MARQVNFMVKRIANMLAACRACLGVCFAVLTLAVQAADDTLLAFSTKGPDRYADGTPVLEGEMYAVVWTKAGSDFAGFDMNGQAVDTNNNAVVVALPRGVYSARCGGVRCPKTLFQITASVAAKYAGGTYALALLDTRVSDGKGGLVPSGRLDQVKGWGLVEKSRVKAVSEGAARATGLTGVTTTHASAVPAGEEIPQPRITGISVKDGLVTLTVKGTSNRLLYNVAAGDRPGRHQTRHAASVAVQGHARADREITLVMPVAEGQNFFQVVRN